ncbi:MAG: type B 50S ribosomal protein L31 [Myxococcales bacterium]|nr:type B 50S ribosomal protein L31 [Myxococcales bacterium]
MKPDIHPEYRFVLFRDVNNGDEFITRSCAPARDTATHDGQEYPLIVLDVSSTSHPFYTGTQRIMDTEGRVERFMRKYGFGSAEQADEASEAATPDEPTEPTDGPAEA